MSTVLGLLLAAASIAPAIEHAPVSCVPLDRHPVLEARLEPADAVSRGRAYFRAGGTRHWYYVELKPASPGLFSAALPRPVAPTTTVEYYLEVLDRTLRSERTPEREMRVASTCDAEIPGLMAATIAVGSVGGGAPSLPAGFSNAGLVSLPVTAAAGGGVPAAAIVGGAAVAAGAAAVVVVTGGGTEPCPAVVFHEIALDCDGIRREARAGCDVGLQVGVGRWATPSEMQQALGGHRGVISVDGQELSVTNEGPTLHSGGGEPAGFGDRARARWKATAGDHVVIGFWTVHPDAVSRCVVSVGN